MAERCLFYATWVLGVRVRGIRIQVRFLSVRVRILVRGVRVLVIGVRVSFVLSSTELISMCLIKFDKLK